MNFIIRLTAICTLPPYSLLGGVGHAQTPQSTSLETPATALPYPATPQFTLDGFNGVSRGNANLYEGSDAKRLASEVLPHFANATRTVTVRQSLLAPGALYLGLLFDFALDIEGRDGSLCEEPHVVVNMIYDMPSQPPRDRNFSIANGILPDHHVEASTRFGRYWRLPGTPATPDGLVAICRLHAGEASTWKTAPVWSSFVMFERQLARLLEALRGEARVRCRDASGKTCAKSRAELIDIVTQTPPDFSASPDFNRNARIHTFDFYRRPRDGGVVEGYSVTIKEHRNGRVDLDFSFIRSVGPVV